MYFLKKSFEVISSRQAFHYIKNGRALKYIIRSICKYSGLSKLFYLSNIFIEYLKIKKYHMQIFKYKDFDRFENIVSNNYIKDEDVHRVIEAYKKSKNDQNYQPEPYQIGSMWQKILNTNHKVIIDAVQKNNFEKIKTLLSNFGRNDISKGLSLSGGLPRNFIERLAWTNTFNRNHYCWSKLTKNQCNLIGYKKEIGNMPGMIRGGEIILQPSFRLSYFARKILNLTNYKDDPIVIEIGGGFGGIPYHLFNNQEEFKGIYINFDIPEICLIASYFLLSCFPSKKILLYGEKKFNEIDLYEYDMIIMPNYILREFHVPYGCDLVFNSHSFTEMDYNTVTEYLHQIERLKPIYFLHANHEYKYEYLSEEGKTKKTVDLSESEFELNRDKYKLLYRFPELIQNVTANYGEYSYWEYLYQKI